jgi:large subunit ribosomal protein L14e
MMEVGRVCLKIAGRDAGKKCVIVDVVGDNRVLIDGETRRRNCNIAHLEPTKDTMDVKKGAAHADVLKAFSKIGIDIKVSKPKKAAERPRQIRSAERKKAEEAEKPAKKEVKTVKKETAKTESGTKKAEEKSETSEKKTEKKE